MYVCIFHTTETYTSRLVGSPTGIELAIAIGLVKMSVNVCAFTNISFSLSVKQLKIVKIVLSAGQIPSLQGNFIAKHFR